MVRPMFQPRLRQRSADDRARIGAATADAAGSPRHALRPARVRQYGPVARLVNATTDGSSIRPAYDSRLHTNRCGRAASFRCHLRSMVQPAVSYSAAPNSELKDAHAARRRAPRRAAPVAPPQNSRLARPRRRLLHGCAADANTLRARGGVASNETRLRQPPHQRRRHRPRGKRLRKPTSPPAPAAPASTPRGGHGNADVPVAPLD